MTRVSEHNLDDIYQQLAERARCREWREVRMSSESQIK